MKEIVAYRRQHAPQLGPWLSQAAAGAWFGLVGRRSPVLAPTLILHGDADEVMDVRNGEVLARGIPGAKLVVFEDAGHLLFWEDPDRFVAEVTAFCTAADETPLLRPVEA